MAKRAHTANYMHGIHYQRVGDYMAAVVDQCIGPDQAVVKARLIELAREHFGFPADELTLSRLAAYADATIEWVAELEV